MGSALRYGQAIKSFSHSVVGNNQDFIQIILKQFQSLQGHLDVIQGTFKDFIAVRTFENTLIQGHQRENSNKLFLKDGLE